jgi:hypothetical protein
VLRLVDSITPSIAKLSRPHPSPLPNWVREQESGSPSPILGEGLGDEGENLGINKSIVLKTEGRSQRADVDGAIAAVVVGVGDYKAACREGEVVYDAPSVEGFEMQ